MDNKDFNWRPMSEYTGGRVLATNGLDVLIGEINSDGDCESEENSGTILCGITGFIKIEEMLPELKESEDNKIKDAAIEFVRQNKSFNYRLGISKEEVIAWIKKQDRQKPDDKVEPKFHEGEWVVSSRYTSKPFCITKICDTYYLVDNDSFIPFEQESDWRLWTIQDAKDGDVLAAEEDGETWIGIFKELDVDNTLFFSSYCQLPFGGSEIEINIDTLYSEGCHPATKEQRDTLMKAMADAGYTFDFEKKELKEIEPDEWSDECCINQLIVFCENCMVQDTNAKRCANFLKSLKDRYTWKPSDEQMDALLVKIPFENSCNKVDNILKSLYYDLKKLIE